MRFLLLGILLLAALPASAQCPCQNPDPYAKLTPAAHREKFDAAFAGAAAAYGKMMAAARAGNRAQAREAARTFARAWDAVAGGFWMHPPRGLDRPATWARWFPVADERLSAGVQLILSTNDLPAACRKLESGRWALARIREENGAATVGDFSLRAVQAAEELRWMLAGGEPAGIHGITARLETLAAESTRYTAPLVTVWRDAALAAVKAPGSETLSALQAAAARLRAETGDRLD